MSKEFEITKESPKSPELDEIISWQETYSSLVGRDQFSKWKRDPFEMSPLAKPLEDLDGNTIKLLGKGVWNINKATPLTNSRPLVALGGWCTFSEGDTNFIYQGQLPDGTRIDSPDVIYNFLQKNGNRWEQVLRCIGPVSPGIPYLVVVEDSLWAQRISAKLGKSDWEKDLTQMFKQNAKDVSEKLITNWLSAATGQKRRDVFFFYTSEIKEYLEGAINDFADVLTYETQRNAIFNMPILTMYTGFWLNALKKIGKFENDYQELTVPNSARAVISEVDIHFKLRGKEQDLVGPFFWRNQIGDFSEGKNPNREISVAGFYQPRVPLANQKMIPAYSLPFGSVLNYSNRKSFVESLSYGLTTSVEKSGRFYPFSNPILVDALNSLYWIPAVREQLNLLTTLPKEGGVVKTNSAKPVDERYIDIALKVTANLLEYLSNTYENVGYS